MTCWSSAKETNSATGINDSLKQLQLFTGLTINKSKSKVFFPPCEVCRNKESIAEILGVSIGSLLIRYLGLPLSSVYPKPRHYSPLIDKVMGQIEGWQLHYLLQEVLN